MGLYQRYIFPRFYDQSIDSVVYRRACQQLLSSAEGRVLEVGVGTGLSLSAYGGAVIDYVGLDYNEAMLEQAVTKSRRLGSPASTFVLSNGEDLPFADDTFDTVVTVFTLCSLGDVSLVLREIARVSKRGGRYLFLEHGADRSQPLPSWQRLLGILPWLCADGCHVERDIPRLVEEGGFEIDSLVTPVMPSSWLTVGTTWSGQARLQ